MEKRYGLCLGLLVGALIALSYFMFCPHAGRNGNTVEVHMHVIPVDVPRVRIKPEGELPSGIPDIPNRMFGNQP